MYIDVYLHDCVYAYTHTCVFALAAKTPAVEVTSYRQCLWSRGRLAVEQSDFATRITKNPSVLAD